MNWHFEKTSAEDDVRKLSGVRGITNMIAIKPHIDSSNVKSKIDSALKRHAEVEANAIKRQRSRMATRSFLKVPSIAGASAARSKTRRGQPQGSYLSKTA